MSARLVKQFRRDYTQKDKTDGRVLLTLADQHNGMELDRMQAHGYVRNNRGTSLRTD